MTLRHQFVINEPTCSNCGRPVAECRRLREAAKGLEIPTLNYGGDDSGDDDDGVIVNDAADDDGLPIPTINWQQVVANERRSVGRQQPGPDDDLVANVDADDGLPVPEMTWT